MAVKRYFKNMLIAGKAFCIYNISQTGVYPIYKHGGKTYFKPRKQAQAAQVVNGVTNMVYCTPITIGAISGYIEYKPTNNIKTT
jgi:hypothetical protein